MPVFLCRVAVALDIADNFGIYLCGSIETEGSFDNGILEVAVNCFGAADNLDAGILCLVVFGEDGGVGVGVVAADDYNSGDAEFTQDFKTFVELFNFLEFGTARADDVEAAGVAVFVDDGSGQLDIAVFNKSGRTHEEAEQAAVAMNFLDTVEKAADNVVAAGSLAAGQDYTHVYGLAGYGAVVFLKTYFGKAVGVGEQCADGILVGYGFGGLAFNDFYSAGESYGKFGLIACAGCL